MYNERKKEREAEFNEKKIFHHMFVTLLMAFVILLCACSGNERREEDSFEADDLETDSLDVEEDVTQMDVDFDEPIRVFYMDRAAGLLTNFAALYPDIKLERCPIYPNFKGQDLDIAYWAEKWAIRISFFSVIRDIGILKLNYRRIIQAGNCLRRCWLKSIRSSMRKNSVYE